MAWAEVEAFLVDDDPVVVFTRTCGCVIWWCLFRLSLSHLVFCGSVVHGTKCTAAIHATVQAIAITWVVTHDPNISPLYWALLRFRLADADILNVTSPAVSFLATLAAGEFGMQMLHLRAWYEKPADLVLVAHHVLCLVLWPTNVANRRGLLFVTVFLTYEISTPFLMALFFDNVKKTSVIKLLVGTAFMLSFVLVRLGTLPATLVACYKSLNEFPSPNLPRWYTGQYAFAMSNVERLTAFVPLLVNSHWGLLVIRGYLRALRSTLLKPAGVSTGDTVETKTRKAD
eukprot:CAMPEP_0183334724 /NCGR_PEP_ID=MMETSP0164_2-20130417/3236_1 /TAXON_ID=221442 /ORGANISM="Coccolithus pelagicus ssp braarudi, Strain PLY182g" /LENGTH=285 /DNA_ID=CAMNT_0025503919 /DNA_START=13 /DNA_END=870 /DNA_ORIENTATION=+